MTTERWQRLESICHAALARPAEERAAFVAEACGGDHALRQEAESLVARAGSVSSFLETPANDDTRETLKGRRLGPYNVIDLLGAGGMGEVYRARDTRLGREVAIKTLPPDRLADQSRRRRFIQEARAASALNHPNIVTIHEIESIDGIDLIVMELVSGKTLTELIRRRMTISEALRLAVPIADALTRAHAAGIVHRDLKPANIMVTADGLVKILDFGLAKLVDLESPIVEPDTVSISPSAAAISVAGAVVGTPAYMSPEQATGADVDARSDIFSFGAVLYEMITARRAFSGDSATETLGAVVHVEPKGPSELATGVPKGSRSADPALSQKRRVAPRAAHGGRESRAPRHQRGVGGQAACARGSAVVQQTRAVGRRNRGHSGTGRDDLGGVLAGQSGCRAPPGAGDDGCRKRGDAVALA